MNSHHTRRQLLQGATAFGAMTLISAPAIAQAASRVIVIGGGFGGVSAARTIKQLAPKTQVTLIEASATFTACPLSNLVIAGMRDLPAQQFGYDKVRAGGINVVIGMATGVNAANRTVRMSDGVTLPYDRLVLSPGIDLRWDTLPGYNEAASATIPHAWKAGEQTTLLRKQLEAMEDGGMVVMSVPANPYRCPPGPYERASLIAHYLRTKKPKSKLIVLDAKDQFSKQRLFQSAWKQLYPDNLEWVGLSQGGKVTSVDPAALTLKTDFASHTAKVVNVIPPQKAGRIAEVAGVANNTGWCPVDATTFESSLVPGIHVVGDAIIAGGMPKSAFSANAQAKVCAAAVVKLLAGEKPATPKLINTCYSLVGPEYGISVAGVYRPVNNVLTDVEGAGGVSPLDAPGDFRVAEASYAEAWFRTITSEVWG